MPTIEEFDDDFEFELPTPPPAAGASGSRSLRPGASAASLSYSGTREPTAEETKDWICLYPIYFDAKRKLRGGCRRIKYDDAALYPQSVHLAHACQLLGVKFHHELFKQHPQDWENPGRVKVQLFKENGDPLQAHIPNKQELLKAMAKLIQPIAGGKPPSLPPSQTEQKQRQSLLCRERQIRKTAHKRGFRLAQPAEDDEGRFSVQSMLPPHSPALEMGALNVDMAKAMGAAGQGLGGGMGALGGMLSGLGFGGDDDDEDEGEEAPKVDKPLTPLEKQQQMIAQMGRRQRKKVVRIGR